MYVLSVVLDSVLYIYDKLNEVKENREMPIESSAY